jgi:nitrite reductase/ring-hydroxylating ferredoxin subunit
MDMERWIRVAALGDLQAAGFGTLVDADGIGVALFQWHGKVYAVENLCPHMGFPLAESTVHNGEIICGWHGWHINLADGACRREKISARVFPCEVRGSEVFLLVETLTDDNVISSTP